MKKRIIILLAIILSLALFAGCAKQPTGSGDKGTEPGDGKKKPVIGVSLFYRSDEFYIDIENMMKVKAEELGVDLVIQDANINVNVQLQQFEDFIQMKVDAIVFSPCDPAACVAAVQSAVAAGIPVFTYDGVMEDKTGITSGMYNDFRADGNALGEWTKEYITKNLDGKAKVAILDFPASPIVCGLRADGFAEIIETLPGVEIVARQDGAASRTGGMAAMENILTSNNNEIDLVFAINYESGAGAAAAIEAAKAKTVVTCVAWGEEALKRLEADDPILKAYMLGNPADQAEILKVAKDHLDGKQVAAETYYKYLIVDRENLESKIDWKAIIDLRK